MRSGRIRFLLPLLLLGVTAIAGCGASKSSSSTTSTATAAVSTSSTSTSMAAPATAAAVKLTTKHSKLGTILAAGPKKLTVYLFEKDNGAASSCSGACAATWPPVTGKAAAVGLASASDLGTITRADGTTQVTYHGHPLYYFARDKDDGDAYGQNLHQFGADWYVLAPSGKKVDES